MTPRLVRFEVNGLPVEVTAEPRDTLLDVVRSGGLTGAHAGCETGVCGACTVLLDGRTVRSCLVLGVQCEGHAVMTIESLGTPDDLHPVMQAFHERHGLQCGFCTPAMVLTAIELLADEPSPSEASVRRALAGNLCRCTGYAGIVDAVLAAAAAAAVDLAEPTAPTEPDEPAEPDEPDEPDEWDEPGALGEPDIPGDDDESGGPGGPDQPGQADEPGEAGEPVRAGERDGA